MNNILLFLFLILGIVSCKFPQIPSGQELGPVPSPSDPCKWIVEDSTIQRGERGGFCVKYPEQRYSNPEAGENLFKIQNNLHTKNKTANFINFISPICVKVQAISKLPASVCLAQAINETGWGSQSISLKNGGNNLFGHSCWKRGSFTTEFMLPTTPPQVKKIKWRCQHPRPITQGGYYMSFDSLEDSVWMYTYNLLWNKGTAKAYADLRTKVKAAQARKIVPNWYPGIVGSLHSYAAGRKKPGVGGYLWTNYTKDLGHLINNYHLDRFDKTNTCGSGSDDPGDTCKKVFDSNRSLNLKGTQYLENSLDKNGAGTGVQK